MGEKLECAPFGGSLCSPFSTNKHLWEGGKGKLANKNHLFGNAATMQRFAHIANRSNKNA